MAGGGTHREVMDAIAWTFQTGSQWIHHPKKYGKRRGVHNRLRMWTVDGTWERAGSASSDLASHTEQHPPGCRRP
ncbi:transposase [[Kitasatospora] papulosa]|uniref:transposase n=1 Tax=Streptomyces TaxID=1883 RepID=UPI00331BE023